MGMLASLTSGFSLNDEGKQRISLKVLLHVAPKGDEAVVDSLIACCNHHFDWARARGIEALRQLTPKNNTAVISTLTTLTQEDPKPIVVQAALKALSWLAEKGHKPAYDAAVKCLGHNDPW